MAKKVQITHEKGHRHADVVYPAGSIIDGLDDASMVWIVDQGIGSLIDVVDVIAEDKPRSKRPGLDAPADG